MLALTSIVCTLLNLSGTEVELVHAPRVGSSRSVVVEATTDLMGGELTCELNGEAVPAEYLPDLFLETTDVRRLELTETTEDGGWLRRYDAVSWENQGSFSMDYQGAETSYPWSSEAETALEGRAVRVIRADDGSLSPAFADEGPDDPALLAGLRADLGLSALLPDGPVAEGDAWTVDGSELGALFDPCGDLQWELPPGMDELLLHEVRTRVHGGALELSLTEVGADGTRATCRVEGQLTRTTTRPGDLSRVPVADGTATDTVTETWDVEGELVWDLAADTMLVLDLDGELLRDTRTVRDPDQPGSTYESTFSVSGSYGVTFEIASIEAD